MMRASSLPYPMRPSAASPSASASLTLSRTAADAGRPLAGITVLDFGQVYQGPYATLLIRARSATVIRRRCQQLIEAKTKGLTIKPAGRVNAIAGHRFDGRPERSFCVSPLTPQFRRF